MILVLIGVLTLATTYLISYWQRVEQRQISYDLHHLRDHVRAAAIADPAFRASPAFHILDAQITGFITHQNEYSIWFMAPAVVLSRRSPLVRAQVQEEMSQLQETPITKKANETFGFAILRTLVARHIFLALALLAIGIILLPLALLFSLIGALIGTMNMKTLRRVGTRIRDFFFSAFIALAPRQGQEDDSGVGIHASA
jgi:hypothetical protein